MALIIFITWSISIAMATPTIISSEAMKLDFVDAKVCTLNWGEKADKWFNIMLMVLTYFIPLVTMVFINIRNTHNLWCQGPVGVLTQQMERSVKKKKKAAMMLWMLLIYFGICSLPYHSYFIVAIYYPEMKAYPGIQHIFLSFYWFAMSHAIVNPIVYFIMNKK